MRADAFVGLIAFCALLSPPVVLLVLRRWGKLDALQIRHWLLLYALGVLMCLAVLPRKHMESAIIMRWPRDVWAYHLAQVDNEWWEQAGKLVALLLALWLAGASVRPLFQVRRSALALGYWAGLCYGVGEALILAALFTWPQWAPLFGMRTYTPYLIGWAFVRERLWAMHLHAVMGALIGLGLFGWLALGSRARLVAFFVLAMLFHHVVDGLIISAAFTPAVAHVLQRAGELLVPALVALGWGVLAVAALVDAKTSGKNA